MGESLSPKTSDTLSTSTSSRPRQQAKGQEAEQKPHRRALRAQGSKICSSSTVRQDHSYSLTRGQMQREKWGSKRGGAHKSQVLLRTQHCHSQVGAKALPGNQKTPWGQGSTKLDALFQLQLQSSWSMKSTGTECHLPSTSCRRPCFGS